MGSWGFAAARRHRRLVTRFARDTIGIGSDHNGFELKQRVRAHLAERGERVHDFGCFSRQPVDYPDIAAAVADAVRSGLIARAILVCGSGLGMAIAANKVPGIRAALCHDAETAKGARIWNHANVLALGLGFTTPEGVREILDAWFSTPFDEEEVANVARVAEMERQSRS